MNAFSARLAVTTGLLFGATVLASAPAMADHAQAARPGTLVVDCATKARPSQVAVTQSLGINNLSEAYAARSRLMGEVHRACHRKGTTHVQIVAGPSHKRSLPPATQVAMEPVAQRATPR